MDCNEQQSELSRELEKADRRIRIARLKNEAEEISGGEMVSGGDEDEDSPVTEEFWERVLEFEKAPRGTRFAQLEEAGVALPPPESLSDANLHGKLREVIRKLAKLRVFLCHTDHLSDRDLYARLWDDLLKEETTILPPDPDSACHLDVIGGGSAEDIEIGLKYYDDEEDRVHWHKSFPEDPIPNHENPPYDRDRLLPERDYRQVGSCFQAMSKPKHHPTRGARLTLRDKPFAQLVVSVQELAAARREHAGKSPEERRAAASWAYDSGMAHHLFSSAVRSVGDNADLDSGLDSGVMALAIDPCFAPTLLTVGSLEYQYKRPDAAMELFMTLTTLPQTEPDLTEIIDKAGGFLLDQNDTPHATRLYRAATEAYPGVCEHWSSLSYCLGKAGRLEEAVSTARKALSLNEDDPHVLNDLGWTLVLAGFHDEARMVLERAAALAPADYALPRNNLRELDKRVRSARRNDKRAS